MAKNSFWDVFAKLATLLPVAIETAEAGASILAPGKAAGVEKAAAVTQVILAAIGTYAAANGQSIADHPDTVARIAQLITGAVGLRNILVGKPAAASAPPTVPVAPPSLGAVG